MERNLTRSNKRQRFGQRRPPLTELIQGILQRYPDGGQILKELIQNADDAGATEVNFLCDDRSYGCEFLESPELAQFQGPSLYCHNNAKFEEEDWEGIQNLMRSSKKDDPLKVGRFGIGFNSVYHITDLPGIVSGDTVGFLDPHEVCFTDENGRHGVSGKRYFFDEDLLQHDSRDQFASFHGIFGCNLHDPQGYNGTLFRFPLRTSPSDLSKRKYTKEMVEHLFQSLKDEASLILLFLKSVSSIKIYTRNLLGEVKCVFTVEVGGRTREEVKQKRQEFLRSAAKRTITESRYVMEVQVTSYTQSKCYHWLVVNQVGSNLRRISDLARELNLLSWIGMAFQLDSERETTSFGRIFCLLPLPPDVDCQTGLPVHVHGYFGLTDNRRGLMWPGIDCQNTSTAEWNELLLKNIAIEVYCKLLEVLLHDRPSTGVNEERRSQLVYSCLPSLEVRGHWKVLLDPLFQKLVRENREIFYARQSFRTSWVNLRGGALDCLPKSATRDAVLRTLLNSTQTVISDVPDHVMKIIEMYYHSPNLITPTLLRFVLKTQKTSVSYEDKMLLLEFILEDDATYDLEDVPLLPLANGEFTTFSAHVYSHSPSRSVFVPSPSCKATLLPNTSHRFLSENIPGGAKEKLCAMAAVNAWIRYPTQLVRLNKEIVLENLRSSLPSEWFNGNEKVQWIPGNFAHPPESWLEEIWSWIYSCFPISLSELQGIPLIDLLPSTTSQNSLGVFSQCLPLINSAPSVKWLGILSSNSKFIFKCDISGNQLPNEVIKMLTVAQCIVLPSQPRYLCHPDINSYIAPATPVGATSLLSNSSLQSAQKYLLECLSSERDAIREFIARFPRNLTPLQRRILRQLPLFDTLNGSPTAVQSDNSQAPCVASAQLNLPAGFKLRSDDQIISSAAMNSYQILQLLDVKILKTAEVLSQILFPNIQSGVYSPQETSSIMLWILQRLGNLERSCPGFQDEVKHLSFVAAKNGNLKKPLELYDPNDAVLSSLFGDDSNKFPSDDYRDAHIILTLKKLGLRSRMKLTGDDLLKVVVQIASSTQQPSSWAKVKALVEVFNDDPDHLTKIVDSGERLKYKLRELKWLPRATEPPHSSRFPAVMPWYKDETQFYAPAELRNQSQALLVGSSMPILGINLSENLQNEMYLTADPPISQVVGQLKTAVIVWSEKDQRKASSHFQEMLLEIYHHFSQVSWESVSAAIARAALDRWIWHGSGFCAPSDIAFKKSFPFSVEPQLFLMPDELKDEESLTTFFRQCGVRESFQEEDLLSALDAIRDKYDDLIFQGIAPKETECDLQLCRSILEWMVRDGETLNDSRRQELLVPVHNAKNTLMLKPCDQCSFYDQEWLRAERRLIESENLIHESIPARIADLLGVPRLSTSLLSAESLSYDFEELGPNETITTRLSTILNEYKDGVGIFKELIQNADDARASKVCFLVDWRHGPKTKLLSPEMAECQGPALWAYNDAVFTDEDFVNVTKIDGATKLQDLTKIGRFGLGFNAVYHITDVPSFISRNHLVIFDPNLSYLDYQIKNKSHPGIRINLSTHRAPLIAFPDQFQLYEDVFDCKIQSNGFYYNGTLFRFPFRTASQQQKSKISQNVYSEEKVKDLVESLRETASVLLLFTQHVKEVELFVLNQNESPSKMKLELSVTKSTPEVLRCDSRRQTPFIEECSAWWQGRLRSSNERGPSRLEVLTTVIQDRENTNADTDLMIKRCEQWLLTSSVGEESSAVVAGSDEGRKQGLLPCAGAAAKIMSINGSEQNDGRSQHYHPEAVVGEVFCFLPLSLSTGLPVHLNSSFAITSNRRGIWERDAIDCHQPLEVRWNESLMQDALCNVYIGILQDMKTMCNSGKLSSYQFHTLWPCYDQLRSASWNILVRSFYRKLVENSERLFCSDGKWLTIREGRILDEQLQEVPEVAQVMKQLGLHVFLLPQEICKSLEVSGCGAVLDEQTLNVEEFLFDVFRPIAAAISPELRDPIICHALDCSDELESSLQDLSCVTCSSDGSRIAKPSELINPKGAAAALFSEEDHRFPVGDHYLTENRSFVLEKLGMVKDVLSWKDICDRAASVTKLSSIDKIKERASNIIEYLVKSLEDLPAAEQDTKAVLQNTKFLPVMSKPPGGYFLVWKGCEYDGQFASPKELFLSSDIELVGSSSLIADVVCESHELKQLLGFNNRPSVDNVLHQLDTAITSWSDLTAGNSSLTAEELDFFKSVSERIYQFLEAFVLKDDEEEQNKHSGEPKKDNPLSVLEEKKWIFIQGRFLSSENVAKSWLDNGAPFLYCLPDEYGRKYGNLWKATNLKESFNEEDYLRSLRALEKKGSSPLSDDELDQAILFLRKLKETEHKEGKEENDAKEKEKRRIPLPDTDKILRFNHSLTVNLKRWLQGPKNTIYVHPKVPAELAVNLGVQPLRKRILKKYSNTIGESFGQNEKLTDRIRNILKNYPFDSTILKELVQNADDAEASEIHFIHDMRVLPHERVFLENAEEIQGPALCVYNNRPFLKKDLKGIEKLGIGSKGEDPEKTGQYGIGFNAVYHLTDCPSFLSNDDTLVVLDPHCRYAPEATRESPGEHFRNVDSNFRKHFSDSFLGYLRSHFKLQGSTMFRLPLRTTDCSLRGETRLAKQVGDEEMTELLDDFQNEARRTLMFLNHIKRITISKIGENNRLEKLYEVEASLKKSDDKKRRKIFAAVKEYKKSPTVEIPFKSETHRMTISDSSGLVEDWLVHQRCGVHLKSQTEDDEIPEGHRYGLFPRGGVAARLPSSPSRDTVEEPNEAYCVLPLPVPTSLPVKVNGHFALDSSRRGIWRDTKPNSELSRWNDFIKSKILAPAYATLICESRRFIPHINSPNMQWRFPDSQSAKAGLRWYNNLFPDTSTDSDWKILTNEVYQHLRRTGAEVLPLVIGDEDKEPAADRCDCSPSNKNAKQEKDGDEALPQTIQKWLSVHKGYFTTEEHALAEIDLSINNYEVSKSESQRQDNNEESLEERVQPKQAKATKKAKQTNLEKASKLLLRISLPLLLYTPVKVLSGFQAAGVDCCVISPTSLIEFLRNVIREEKDDCIGKLPLKLENSKLRNVRDLHTLINYCKEDEYFFKQLEGLPLLLTADGLLRVFDSKNPVYSFEYSDLLPSRGSQFIHSHVRTTYSIGKMLQTQKDPVHQVILEFTVADLVNFMPDIFPPKFNGAREHVTWDSQQDGLTKDQLALLWDFLQDYVKRKSDQSQASLECLDQWAILPTTNGKLVAISEAKTVLDMTETGTETTRQKKILQILRKLNCPVLDQEITHGKKSVTPDLGEMNFANEISTPDTENAIEEESPSKKEVFSRQPSATDPYVAHPHKATDVLYVLDYMRRKQMLHGSTFSAEDVREFLLFFKDLDKSENDNWKEMLRSLPLHTDARKKHVSLSLFYTHAFVPSGVPLDGIEPLQRSNHCLFLDSDVLPSLKGLYKSLGIQPCGSVSRFYIDFILPQFDIFSRITQEKYLKHLREESKFSRERRDLFASLFTTRCVPSQQGNLAFASQLFDPRNEVFKVMLSQDKFPLQSYSDDKWLDFFKIFGLQSEFHVKNRRLFKMFCRQVSDAARQPLSSAEYFLNARRSKALVKRLFKEVESPTENLKDPTFLADIASIRFVVSDPVSPGLSSIHKQYGCFNGERPPFIAYSNSVCYDYEEVVWTTAPILPKWAQPEENLENCLGISRKPKLDDVVSHLENICKSLKSGKTEDETAANPGELLEVMTTIYNFLTENLECRHKEVTDECSENCQMIGRRLGDKACMFVNGTVIKGTQFCFKLPGNDRLSPFLYKTPREYGAYEHLLKRLGATEEVTSCELAKLLKDIKNSCQGEPMDSDLSGKAIMATVQLLKCVHRESCTGILPSKIDELRSVFLPSSKKILIASKQLVSAPQRLVDAISDQDKNVLFPLEQCGLPWACIEKYLAALPERLRPIPFDSIVREELDPSSTQHCDGNCSFIVKYTDILRSEEFQEGVASVLRHQKRSANLTGEEEQWISRFRNPQRSVDIVCMKTLNLRLVSTQTNEIFREYTRKVRHGHVVYDGVEWKLYIVHDTRYIGSLAALVNEVMNSCVGEKFLTQLTDMLQCESSSEISKFLADQDIGSSSTEDYFWLDEGDELLDDPRRRSEVENYFKFPADPNEGKRWLKQALRDLKAAQSILSAEPSLACFHSHEAVEKSLKAVLYGKYGIDSDQKVCHKVLVLAHDIEDMMHGESRLSLLAERVKNYYVPPRYPNAHPRYFVPADMYDQEEGETAIQTATELVKTVKRLMDC